jgi:hypothetical protein
MLMAADIRPEGNGFHRLNFKVDGGRNGMATVTVNISADAHRKLLSQMKRARFPNYPKDTLIKSWARWAIALRLEDLGVIPPTVTVTASDVDDFGGYASELNEILKAS